MSNEKTPQSNSFMSNRDILKFVLSELGMKRTGPGEKGILDREILTLAVRDVPQLGQLFADFFIGKEKWSDTRERARPLMKQLSERYKDHERRAEKNS